MVMPSNERDILGHQERQGIPVCPALLEVQSCQEDPFLQENPLYLGGPVMVQRLGVFGDEGNFLVIIPGDHPCRRDPRDT